MLCFLFSIHLIKMSCNGLGYIVLILKFLFEDRNELTLESTFCWIPLLYCHSNNFTNISDHHHVNKFHQLFITSTVSFMVFATKSRGLGNPWALMGKQGGKHRISFGNRCIARLSPSALSIPDTKDVDIYLCSPIAPYVQVLALNTCCLFH